MMIYRMIIGLFFLCFQSYAQADYHSLMVWNNEIEALSKGHNTLPLATIRVYVAQLKSVLEKPYKQVMTLLADTYELFSIDDRVILAKLTGYNDEETLERARLWCLRCIGKYAALLLSDDVPHDDVHKAIATKIRENNAGVIRLAQQRDARAHTQQERGSISLVWGALVSSFLGGIYAYTALQSRMEKMYHEAIVKGNERNSASDLLFKKVDQHIMKVAQQHGRDLSAYKQEYATIERRLRSVQDDVRATNESLAGHARSTAQVITTGFAAQDEVRTRLAEKVDRFADTMKALHDGQLNGLVGLRAHVNSNKTLAEDRIENVVRQVEKLKQSVEEQGTLILAVKSALIIHGNKIEVLKKIFQEMRNFHDEYARGVIYTDEQIATLGSALKNLHQKLAKESSQDEGILSDIARVGSVLCRVGEGLSSLKNVLFPG